MNEEHEGFSDNVHRYLDGEPHRPLTAEDRRRADRIKEISGEIRRRSGRRLDVSDRVMREVRRSQRPSQPAWVRPLEPRAVRLRPAVLVPSLAAAAIALFLAGMYLARETADPSRPLALVARNDTVYVRFELIAPSARSVYLAGSFNEWRPDEIPLARTHDGHWTVTIPLSVGEHSYQFVVNGERWVPDPNAEAVDDGFGGRNSVLVVGPRGVVGS